MHLFGYELKKLLSMPMLWAFLALCLLLNGFIIFSSRYNLDFVNYVSRTAAVIGNRMGGDFDGKLAKQPDSEFHTMLASQTAGAVDTFENTDVTKFAEDYIKRLSLPGFPAELMKKKYEKLQAVVAQLAESDAGLDVYAAAATHELHTLLFHDVFTAISAEACLFAVLTMLCILGFEFQSGTDLLVYSTKAGRRVSRKKIAAALIVGPGGFLVIAGLTLLMFFSVWDFSGIWTSSVSSQFNYVMDSGVVKPFITWRRFSVAGYLGAIVVLNAVLVAVFSLFSAVIGLCARNTYIAFLVFLATALCMMALPSLFTQLKLCVSSFTSMLLPVPLWLISPLWLTDLGGSAVVPYHETIGLIGNVALFSVLTFVSQRLFQRKDLI